jgi:hypothetical protein
LERCKKKVYRILLFDDSWDLAQEIYSEFVSADARMCINISDPVRSELDKTFKSEEGKEKLSPTMFAAAVREVFVLLAQDSVPRFLRQQEQSEPQINSVQTKAMPLETI